MKTWRPFIRRHLAVKPGAIATFQTLLFFTNSNHPALLHACPIFGSSFLHWVDNRSWTCALAQRNPTIGQPAPGLVQCGGDGSGQGANLSRFESLEIVEDNPGMFPTIGHPQRNPAR